MLLESLGGRWMQQFHDKDRLVGHDITVGRDGAVYVGDVYHGMRVQKFISQSR
jgi:hypothetical protein